jgi:hypothetical protein
VRVESGPPFRSLICVRRCVLYISEVSRVETPATCDPGPLSTFLVQAEVVLLNTSSRAKPPDGVQPNRYGSNRKPFMPSLCYFDFESSLFRFCLRWKGILRKDSFQKSSPQGLLALLSLEGALDYAPPKKVISDLGFTEHRPSLFDLETALRTGGISVEESCSHEGCHRVVIEKIVNRDSFQSSFLWLRFETACFSCKGSWLVPQLDCRLNSWPHALHRLSVVG